MFKLPEIPRRILYVLVCLFMLCSRANAQTTDAGTIKGMVISAKTKLPVRAEKNSGNGDR